MPGASKSDDLLIGLSIGTTKTNIIVAKYDSRYPESINVIGLGDAPSRGISKGIIVNPIDVQKSIVRAFEDAVNITGISPERLRRNVVVAFNAMDVKSAMTPGMVVIGGGSDAQVVRKKDLDRVIITAKKRLALPGNMYPLHTIPVHYDLDDRPVENPLNMNGTKLDIMLHTVAVPVTYVSNVITCVQSAGLEIREDVGVVLKPLASALGAVYDDEMRAGCISISIGGGSTGITLFRGGRVFAIKSIPIGGNHITNDLATVMHMSLREAEINKKRIFIQEEEEDLIKEGINIDAALEVVVARIEELFGDYVREALEEYDPQSFTGGIILSGGVSYTPGIERVISDILQLPVRLVDQPVYSMPFGDDNAAYVSSAGILRYLSMIDRDPYFFIPPDSSLPGIITRRPKTSTSSNRSFFRSERSERPERNERNEINEQDDLLDEGFEDDEPRQAQNQIKSRGNSGRMKNRFARNDETENYDDYNDNYNNGYDESEEDDEYDEYEDGQNRGSTRETLSNFLRDLGDKLKDLF